MHLRAVRILPALVLSMPLLLDARAAAAQGPRQSDARVGVERIRPFDVAPVRDAPPVEMQGRRHGLAGALLGGAVGVLASVGTLAACSAQETSHDGPGCGVLIMYMPPVVAGSVLIGGIIGHFITTGGEAAAQVNP